MKKYLLKLMTSAAIFVALSLDLVQARPGGGDDFGVGDVNHSRAVNSLPGVSDANRSRAVHALSEIHEKIKVDDNSLKAAAYWVDLQDFTKTSPTAKIESIPALTLSYLMAIEEMTVDSTLPNISDPDAFRKISKAASSTAMVDQEVNLLERAYSNKKRALAVLEPSLGITEPSSVQIKAVNMWDDILKSEKAISGRHNFPKFDREILESLIYLSKAMSPFTFKMAIRHDDGINMVDAVTYLRTDPAGALGQKITNPTQQEIMATMALRSSKINPDLSQQLLNPNLNQIHKKAETLDPNYIMALAVLEPLGINEPSSQQIKAVKEWDDLKKEAESTNVKHNFPKFDREILESLLYLMEILPQSKSNPGKINWHISDYEKKLKMNSVDMIDAVTYLRTDPTGVLGKKIMAPTLAEIKATMFLRPSKIYPNLIQRVLNPTLDQIHQEEEFLDPKGSKKGKAQEVARKAAETQDGELLSQKPVSFNSTFKTEMGSSIPEGWSLYDGRKGRVGEERTEENPLQVKVIGDGKIKITGDMYNFYYPLPDLKNFAGQEMRFSAKVKSTVPGTRLAYIGKRGNQINSAPHSNREGEETMSFTFKVDSDPESLNNLYFLGGRAKVGTLPSVEISDVKLESVGKKN